MIARPFTIDVSQPELDDLHRRLEFTRWPDAMDDAGWDYGTDRAWLRNLVTWWRDRYDWRAEERRLNEYPHFTAVIDDVRLHFIHRRGSGPDPVLLLLLHGWPSSFVQMLDILPLLADPAADGASPDDSFDVIVASLPGFGFSSSPTNRKMT
ncbi:MAG: epoxide hydrolase family protein, partial [Vicinamibacterales bacterium]